MIGVPFLDLAPMHRQVSDEILQAFETVFKGNWFLLGKQLEEFESSYAQFNNVSHCIGTSNGLDALRICLEVLEIGPGDEVIVPANSFIATSLAVMHTGATPVFAEPDSETYNLNPFHVESLINSKTKAIIPVHLYGQACDIPAITQLANKHGLFIVEDNAQAHGARFADRITGSWGHINATSFYPGKNLGALGDAGGVTTDNGHYAKKAKLLRNYGSTQKYMHECSGFNMRMDDCQAAFLSVKLRYLPSWTEQRRQIAQWYFERLGEIDDIQLPYSHPEAYHVYHLYVIRTARRTELQKFLLAQGINASVHYPTPLHLEKIHTHLSYQKGDLPVAEQHTTNCLSLPLWPGMEADTVDRICTAIKSFYI